MRICNVFLTSVHFKASVVHVQVTVSASAVVSCVRLTAVHCLRRQDCFMRPGPPNFFMSLQK